MANARASWTLDTLGGPHLVGPGGTSRLDRRAAALLAYLALEGPQPRARMAALLWPDVPDSTGRANLRQLVRRLARTAGGNLLEGTDPLALAPGVAVDVVRARELAAGGAHGEVASLRGGFFAGAEPDDVHEELAGWIATVRAGVDRLRVDACHEESRRRQADGDSAGAVELIQRALWIDPLHEASYRELMRLQYLAGDASAAIATYSRCCLALRDGLGVEPAAETVALADEIRRARLRRAPAPVVELPLAVQRPPAMTGRTEEWAAMEAAWAAGKSIVIGGAPGIGKSRLMQEFLTGRGRPLFFRGRPGDAAVPYGTHARTYRELVGAIGGPELLPDWVRRELARIIPQLGDPPPPLASDADRLRFWSAKIEAHRVAYQLGYDCLGFDDLQYVDPASAAAGQYILAQLQGDGSAPVQTVHCYRSGELPPETIAILEQASAAGILLHLTLAPLSDREVHELVGSLGLPQLEEAAGELAAYSGGNPLLVLETAKHLLETGAALPARLPARRAAAVLGARLERLGPVALELARLVAISRDRFSLELAAQITGAAPADLARGWSELEAARIVRGAGFTHDLLCEAVLAGTPEPVRALLEGRVAERLEQTGGEPGAVAAHWQAAGRPERAARNRRKAQVAARAAMLEGEAASYFGDSAGPH